MNNGKKLFRNSLLVLTLLTVGMPVAFAATDTPAAAEQNQGFDDWGLLGLLGLIGLAGLRRKDDDRR
jgi:hypothetical protein